MRSGPRGWFFRYAVLLAILWWILSEGVTFQLWFGALTVIAATVVTYIVTREDLVTFPIRLRALVSLIPYFFYQSYQGGIDVAKAAFTPNRVLKPYYTRFPMAISKENMLARTAFATCICLFPGTLSCRFEGDDLYIHVLDEGMYKVDQTRHVEYLISNIFSLTPEAYPRAT